MAIRGKPSIYLFAVALAAAAFSASAAAHDGYKAPTCALPDSKVPKITQENGSTTLQSWWDDQKSWAKLIDCIASGKLAWVNVGLELHPFSDAGSAEMIDMALGEALGSSPQPILQKAAILVSTIELELVCSAPSADDTRFSSYALAVAEIERREKALTKVKDQDLEPQVDECRADLEKSKSDVADYFRDNPPPAPDPQMQKLIQRGDFATYPASHPATPAGPPALSLLDRSPPAKQSLAFTARPDPGTAPPPPGPGTAPPPPKSRG